MSLALAQWLLGLVAAYGALGCLFALAFLYRGITQIDVSARGMPWSARMLLFPGAVALWPLLLKKWLLRQPPPLT
jgi:hypothetical protein